MVTKYMMYVFEIQPTVSGSLFMFQSAYSDGCWQLTKQNSFQNESPTSYQQPLKCQMSNVKYQGQNKQKFWVVSLLISPYILHKIDKFFFTIDNNSERTNCVLFTEYWELKFIVNLLENEKHLQM